MKTLFLFIAIALPFSKGISQSACNNLGFENGNFDNWTTYTGYATNIDQVNTPSFDPQRFAIMTSGYDPNISVLPVTSNGGGYSCRLGNDNCGAEAEKMTYTYLVSPENALFIYKYAIVLEDPGHIPEEQPSFEVKVMDQNGEITDQTCGFYQVSAGANIPGFITQNYIIYKDWTTVGIDLSPYLGQTITVCFTTRDCEQSGHFGYAYIDAEASRMEIVTKACLSSDTVVLTAPYGFDYLWLPGGFTDRVILVGSDTVQSDYTCTLTSVTGCQVNLSTSVEFIGVFPDFTFSTCDSAAFEGSSQLNPTEIESWVWNFGDGNTSEGLNPAHQYTGAGPYAVALTVTSLSGCQETLSRNILVKQSPTAILSSDTTCAGMPDPFSMEAFRTEPGLTTYFWDFGDGSHSTVMNPDKKYYEPGQYNVSLRLTNDPGCYNDFITSVVINECVVEIPNVFTPNEDNYNEIFYIKNLEACAEKKLTIMNRYGHKVFTSEEYQNEWSPADLTPGVYFYIFEYRPMYNENKTMLKTGYVTLFR